MKPYISQSRNTQQRRHRIKQKWLLSAFKSIRILAVTAKITQGVFDPFFLEPNRGPIGTLRTPFVCHFAHASDTPIPPSLINPAAGVAAMHRELDGWEQVVRANCPPRPPQLNPLLKMP
jgi:hypothetical protein